MKNRNDDYLNCRDGQFRLRSRLSLTNRRIALTALLICALLATARSNPGNPSRYRGGLRNSPGEKRLNEKQLDAIIRNLREKTGFLELWFNQSGFLQLGDRNSFTGGSASARALIEAAIHAKRAIDLESHDNSSIVAFGRLAKPSIYESKRTGETIDVYPIEVDFSDFSRLRGDKRALAAFDVGFVILHELGHAVLNLRDSIDETDAVGECEEYINRIRRELKMPERKHYIARTSLNTQISSMGTIRQAELFFAQSTQINDRVKEQKFLVSWEAGLVGPVREAAAAGSVAGMRKGKSINASVNGQ